MSSTTFALLGSAIVIAAIIGAFAMGRATRVASLKSAGPDISDPNLCRRCGTKIEVDPATSAGIFEGMHWLCFHLEFEHSTDPDLPCDDFAGCPWWTIRYYENRLAQLGVDPKEVIQEGVQREADERYPSPREDG